MALSSEVVRKVAAALLHNRHLTPETWEDVPAAVAYRVTLFQPLALKCANARDCNFALVNNKTEEVQVVDGSAKTLLDYDVPAFVSERLPKDVENWSIIKLAGDGIFAPAANMFTSAQRLIGGPNPITASIAGSVLTGGAGYAIGSLIDRMSPDDYFDSGMRWRLGLTGAALGAVPGAYWGFKQYSRHPRKPTTHLSDYGAGWTQPYPFGKPTPNKPKIASDKQAENTHPMFLPTIPVDAFNRAVWNDVHNPGNVFGTRSAWGDNSQNLGTPPGVAAMVTGMLSGTKAMQGRDHVSPWNVAVSTATGAGLGLIGGTLFGKTMGVLAGLKPDSQKQLQRAGIWGGLMTGAAKSLF